MGAKVQPSKPPSLRLAWMCVSLDSHKALAPLALPDVTRLQRDTDRDARERDRERHVGNTHTHTHTRKTLSKNRSGTMAKKNVSFAVVAKDARVHLKARGDGFRVRVQLRRAMLAAHTARGRLADRGAPAATRDLGPEAALLLALRRDLVARLFATRRVQVQRLRPPIAVQLLLAYKQGYTLTARVAERRKKRIFVLGFQPSRTLALPESIIFDKSSFFADSLAVTADQSGLEGALLQRRIARELQPAACQSARKPPETQAKEAMSRRVPSRVPIPELYSSLR